MIGLEKLNKQMVFTIKKIKLNHTVLEQSSPKDYKITNPSEFNEKVNNLQLNIVNELRNLDWIEIRG